MNNIQVMKELPKLSLLPDIWNPVQPKNKLKLPDCLSDCHGSTFLSIWVSSLANIDQIKLDWPKCLASKLSSFRQLFNGELFFYLMMNIVFNVLYTMIHFIQLQGV